MPRTPREIQDVRHLAPARQARMEEFEREQQERRRGRQSRMEPVVQHARQVLTQVLKVVSPEAAQRSRERLVEVSEQRALPSRHSRPQRVV